MRLSLLLSYLQKKGDLSHKTSLPARCPDPGDIPIPTPTTGKCIWDHHGKDLFLRLSMWSLFSETWNMWERQTPKHNRDSGTQEKQDRRQEGNQQHLLEYLMLTWHLMVFRSFLYTWSLEYKLHELRDLLYVLFENVSQTHLAYRKYLRNICWMNEILTTLSHPHFSNAETSWEWLCGSSSYLPSKCQKRRIWTCIC